MDGVSIIKEHQKSIIDIIRNTTRGDWKVLVLDENTEKIINATVNEDDILNHNIANIERIEERREPNPTMDAIYVISPQPHIVDCLMADFERRRYRSAFLIWTGVLPDTLARRVDAARRQIAAPPQNLFVDFYPRESHLIAFQDPSSFQVLYNPMCNDLVARHLTTLAQKVAAVCHTLGEAPKIRYYSPQTATHEAGVLSFHLARFLQTEIDRLQKLDPNFPPQTTRPQSILLITDRSMDLMAPLLHEFSYQSFIHDVLPLKEQPNGKITYKMVVNEGLPNAEETDSEITERDKLWVENRHKHMADTIERLMKEFKSFIAKNPNFAGKNENETSLNDIRDMLAGLPQFQEMKAAYSLHLTMSQEAMNIFQKFKLSEVASVEQTLATGLDEDLKKPKNVLDQVVRLLDDPAVAPTDRLRLIALYALYRDGMIDQDLLRLLWHASLQRARDSTDKVAIENLELLGARPLKTQLKEVPPRQSHQPLFPPNTKTAVESEEYALSRFEPAVKHMLEDLCSGTLDQTCFPYVIPPQAGGPSDDAFQTQGSLRSAAPRWASANRRQVENRQRIIVFMAGGATYSEARACYEVSEKQNRDVYLVTSHMLTPAKFIDDLRLLKSDRRRLQLPMDEPPKKAPAHLFERPAPPPQQVRPPQPGGGGAGGGAPGMGMGGQMPPGGPRPPTKALGAMTLSSGPGPGGPSGGGGGHERTSSSATGASVGDDKEKKKKKRNIFGMKKDK
ncbi:putative syntaxin-binding protein 2 [Triangularia verruculosa]|uniref:Syntaxin-binding protein 2 n=1 Tax=Triangularia verruculosa TaxID=2587418 RepID=A0AAN7AW49_9PEZI|nr:putative syntaxin-binding protein 2 [Triangularia verruculosa]